MKKNNKKGFTLIELLAVIVILAIIAIITVPMIMNVIDKAKIGALEDSAYGLVEAANLYYSENISTINDKVIFDFVDGEQTSTTKLNYKGKIDNGKLIINTNGKIVTCIDNGVNYAYKELNENKVITGKGTCSYDGTTGDFTIVSDTDALNKKVTDLQNQISNGKNLISTAITNKGIETTSTDSFETMANNINNIKTGKQIVYLGTGTSFDITKYSGWENFTDDNFIVGISNVSAHSWNQQVAGQDYSYYTAHCYGSNTSKSYNSSTGVLTCGGASQTCATDQRGNSNYYGVWQSSQNFTMFAYLVY